MLIQLTKQLIENDPSETAFDETGCFLIKFNTLKVFRRQAENVVIPDDKERLIMEAELL